MSAYVVKQNTRWSTSHQSTIFGRSKYHPTLDNVTGRNPVVRNDLGYYEVSHDDLAILITKPHSCHEVILFDHPFRFYVDIDDMIKIEHMNDAFISEYTNMAISTIQDTFDNLDKIFPDNQNMSLGSLKDPVVLSCTRRTMGCSAKLSLHIIFPNTIIVNREIAQAITRTLRHRSTIPFDDVYKKSQCMRMVNGMKGGYRLKCVKHYNTTLNDSIIVPPDYYDLQSGTESIPSNIGAISELHDYTKYYHTAVETLEAIHRLDMSQYTPIATEDGQSVIRLKRCKSGYCVICQRIHDSDHASLGFYKIDNAMCASFICYRNPSKNLIVFVEEKDKGAAVDVEKEATRANEEDPSTIHQLDDWWLPNAIKCDEMIDFIDKPGKILAFRGPTGSGKTHAIHHMMKQARMDPNAPKFIIVAARVAFTYQMCSRFADLEPVNYKEVIGNVSGDCVIIQIDSLARLDHEYYLDKNIVMVLDEINTLMMHLDGINPERKLNVAGILHTYCTLASKVIIADAYLQREHLLPFIDTIDHQIVVAESSLKPWSNAYMYVHIKEDTFMDALLSYSMSDNVAITSITRRDLMGIYTILRREYDDFEDNVLVLTSETSRAKLKEVFIDINKTLQKKKYIMYTQTLGSGNDILVPMPMFVYINALNMHSTPHEILQQLNRVRTRAPTHLYLKARKTWHGLRNYDEEVDIIKKTPVYSCASKVIEEFRIDPAGEFKIRCSAAASVIRSKSQSNFGHKLFQTIRLYGESLTIITGESPMMYSIKALGDDYMDEQLRSIACAIQNADSEDHSIQHYIDLYTRILRIYQIDYISPDDFKIYQSEGCIKCFRNMGDMFHFAPPIENEQVMIDAIEEMSPSVRDSYLLNKSNKNMRLCGILFILDALGYSSVFDSNDNPLDWNNMSNSTIIQLRAAMTLYDYSSYSRQNKISDSLLIKKVKNTLRRYGLRISRHNGQLRFDNRFAYSVVGSNLYDPFITLMLAESSPSANSPVVYIPDRFVNLSLGDDGSHYRRFLQNLRDGIIQTLTSRCMLVS